MRIQKYRQLAQAGFRFVTLDDGSTALVVGNGKDTKVGYASGSEQTIQDGQFAAARRAPTGPEIDEKRLAAKCCKIKGATFKSEKPHGRRWARRTKSYDRYVSLAQQR